MLGQFLPRLRTKLPPPKVLSLTFLKAKRKFKGLKRLGRGAFGATYSARMNSHPVVVKVGIGTPGLVSPYQAIDSLRREVRILGRLQKYPFVPRILEVGIDYFVMEDVEGVSFLSKLVKGMEPRDILSVAVSQGIMTSILHHEKVAHNDLDPKNILLTPNGVVIIDFGVSLMPEDGAREYREAMERDIITLLENVILAASSKSVPSGVRVLLTSVIEKYKHVLNTGRVNDDTARDISRDLLFALSQLGARSARNRKLAVEQVKVIAV